MADTISWYVTLQLSALAAWPVVARALAALDDRGWVAAKVAGPLAVAWLVWLASMLTPLPFDRVTLAAALLGVGGLAWTLGGSSARAELLAWVRQRRRLLLAWEGLFAAAYTGFAVLRAYDPAIAGTEKPMDMAFLNGFIAARHLPTQDTWLAGYGVPYYYFGYFVWASVARLSGVAPGVAYNLAAATVPALAAGAAASLAWCVVRAAGGARWRSAVAAALAPTLVALAGNLSAPLELLVARGVLPASAGSALQVKGFAQGIQPGVWPPAGAWWWHASRVIPNIQPDGIDEFPFFSAFLSDLHPHFVALPFELLLLAIGAALVLGKGSGLRSPWTQGAAALALGALLTANTWDVASFWPIYLALAWLGASRLSPENAPHDGEGEPRLQPGGAPCSARGRTPPMVRLALVAAAPAAGLAMFAPYFVGYAGPPLGLGLVAERTPLGAFLVLFGPQVALLAVVGAWLRWRAGSRSGWLLAAAGGLGGLLLAALHQPTLGLLLALLALVAPVPWMVGGRGGSAAGDGGVGALVGGRGGSEATPTGKKHTPFPSGRGQGGWGTPSSPQAELRRREPWGEPETIAALLAFYTVAILLGVELVFLRDTFGTRMNTVFKFHYNAWLLAGLGAAIGVALLLGHRGWARVVAVALASVAVVAGLVYPVSAVESRLAQPPASGPTLDGTAFLAPDEAAGVEWLRDQMRNDRVVIAEAVAGEYSSGGRMATYSGAATIIGWPGHELQWRGPLPVLGQREADVERLYRGDLAAIREVLERYHVQYVVVGDLERQRYGTGVDARFANALPVAFRFGRLTIYRTSQSASRG